MIPSQRGERGRKREARAREKKRREKEREKEMKSKEGRQAPLREVRSQDRFCVRAKREERKKPAHREEGMMKRAMGDWRSGWLTGWLAGMWWW